MSQDKLLFLVGTYTSRGAEGIYTLSLDLSNGEMEKIFVNTEVVDPSFLVLNSDHTRAYAVGERTSDDGKVFSFSVNENGSIKLLGTQSTIGTGPCHLAIDSSDSNLIVANYNSGSVCIYPTDDNGQLMSNSDFHQHLGSSSEDNGSKLPNQKGPHAHSVTIDSQDKYAYVCDLGKDMIIVYEIDSKNHKLILRDELNTKTDNFEGPRHFDFHPNLPIAYVINEIGCTVSVFDKDSSGRLTQKQKISTLPHEKYENYSTADIHVSKDGKFLYGSNRGHNSLVIYAIDQNTGKLEYVDNQSTFGDTPRNFVITPDDKMVLAENQDTGDIFSYFRDKQSGKLEPTGKSIKIPAPVCIKFL